MAKLRGDDEYNVLLVRDSSEVKRIRDYLEKCGYYDNSRQIQRISSAHLMLTYHTTYQNITYFGLPITPSCVTYLTTTTPLPPPYTDCTLAHADLPPSKSAKAKSNKPYEVLRDRVKGFLLKKHYSEEDIEVLLLGVPRAWERHGDLVVLPEKCFKDPRWQPLLAATEEHNNITVNYDNKDSVSTTDATHIAAFATCEKQSDCTVEGISKRNTQESLLTVISSALNCKRLAKDRVVVCDQYRSSGAVLLLGKDGWVEHVDNGVCYVFDVTKCMFSSGNVTEKLRVATFNCTGETVVDLYTGIGYFTLPYLVHSRAALVHACEWNSHAVEALKRGLKANKVQDRCIIHEGDNRKVLLESVADRVNLGLVPSSEGGWPVACRALKNTTGGWLHIHGNVSSKTDCEGSQTTQSSEGFVGGEYNLWETKDMHEESTPGRKTEGDAPTVSCTDKDKQVTSEDRQVNAHSSPETLSDEAQNIELKLTDTSIAQRVKCPVSKQKVWEEWSEYVAVEILHTLNRENPQDPLSGREWGVTVGNIEHVKSYAPFVDHLVVDLECRPKLNL